MQRFSSRSLRRETVVTFSSLRGRIRSSITRRNLFPRRVVDEEDLELISTALREADEEIGLRKSDVQILGILDDIVTVTEFIVTRLWVSSPIPTLLR